MLKIFGSTVLFYKVQKDYNKIHYYIKIEQRCPHITVRVKVKNDAGCRNGGYSTNTNFLVLAGSEWNRSGFVGE